MNNITKKKRILDAINLYQKKVKKSDIPMRIAEFKDFFDRNPPVNKNFDILNISDLEADVRVVVFGDTHSDFNSFSYALKKLAKSDYDYFEKAYFIFLGDYLDRGERYFELLGLLFAFKTILSDRCIFLQGNHESIFYVDREICSSVFPSETSTNISRQTNDIEFMKAFAMYFSHLPYFLKLYTKTKKYLLVHGGIPTDLLISTIRFNDISQEYVYDDDKTKQYLTSMLWTYPKNAIYCHQSNVVCEEFGEKQFIQFMYDADFDIMIRGHEPVSYGVESLFKNRLHTLFSTGGLGNSHSEYKDRVFDPAFAIISSDGSLRFENIFSYAVSDNHKEIELRNALMPRLSLDNDSKTVWVNEEFYSSSPLVNP